MSFLPQVNRRKTAKCSLSPVPHSRRVNDRFAPLPAAVAAECGLPRPTAAHAGSLAADGTARGVSARPQAGYSGGDEGSSPSPDGALRATLTSQRRTTATSAAFSAS